MNDLYPDINDPNFNIKIAKRKEFNDSSFKFDVKDAEEEAKRICFSSFELNPHQQFVKNFMSINTPYNSLLLYHGLGTGKTCSAIGISEEMRNYMKQMGITKKIIIVASPNVQENFKQQLFDDRKMEKVGGVWNIHGCSGAKFLAEINPINLKGLSKDKIVTQVNRIINSYYLFMGYGEFANFIAKKSNVSEDFSPEQQEKIKARRLRNTFENRLIIIDEVHNIRNSENKKEKRVASRLDQLIKYVHPLRLLLLSATPMYNDPREIVWLINLMNRNDGRSPLEGGEVFDPQGHFRINERGEETGKELLMRKATGYVSFLKGDNPYTFPYRVFPGDFGSPQSLKKHTYPNRSLLGGEILQRMQYLDLFCLSPGSYQAKIYDSIIQKLIRESDTKKLDVSNMERFGYTLLQKPLEALNMTYPISEESIDEATSASLVGIEGLHRCMNFKSNKSEYEYKPEILEEYGRIFSKSKIGKYSAKISEITERVISDTGICLVYSQFLEGGIIPLALALEELGCKRYDGPTLLKTPPKKKLNIVYTMITGNEDLSPNNALAVKTASDSKNKDGLLIKIILISRAGSEGLDFANIRQVHILDPWYNTNRIEQTIGRAVRNCSHKNLPFTERNVMIFMYATLLKNKFEAADMYVYRVAEIKAILIGRVSRSLKEGSIDCLLNHEQIKSAAEIMKQKRPLVLSNGDKITLDIGDKPFTQQCDYMESCSYSCNPVAKITAKDIVLDTYTLSGNETLIMKIKNLFKEHFFYKKDDLVNTLTYSKPYSREEIDFALDTLVKDKTAIVEDRYGRGGNIINIGDYYIYQPLELDNEQISVFDRSRPIDYKREKLVVSSSLIKTKDIIPDEGAGNEGDNIVKDMTNLFRAALKPDSKLKKSEKNWYKNAANAIVRLMVGGMTKDLLETFVVDHIWDATVGSEKVNVLNYLYSKDVKDYTDFETRLSSVIDTHIISLSAVEKGIYIQEGSEFKLFILEDKQWKKGEKTDNDEFTPLLVKEVSGVIKTLSDIFGFIIPFKETNELIFKTKIKEQKRQSGARCDQASKKDTIKTLNMILNSVKRNENCPSSEFDDDIVKNIGNIELCCYTELVLRCYNHHKLLGKCWFVNPEYAQNVLDNLKN
ncbi:MAG: SNF2-related protein [Vampirovibrionia bacterium]